MEPTSIRLTDEHLRFVESTDFELSPRVRDWLDSQRVDEATGICAHCNGVTYDGATTTVTGDTPLGNAVFHIDDTQEIELCHDCSKDAMERFANDEEFVPLLLEEISYPLYRISADAAADATSGCDWEAVVIDRYPGHNEHGSRSMVFDAVYRWWTEEVAVHEYCHQHSGDWDLDELDSTLSTAARTA